MVDRDHINEDICLLNNILNSPTAVTSVSEMLEQRQQSSKGATSNAAVVAEMWRLRAGAAAALQLALILTR